MAASDAKSDGHAAAGYTAAATNDATTIYPNAPATDAGAKG